MFIKCDIIENIAIAECCHYTRADSKFAPSQWETVLLCNNVSHWLGANQESALHTLQGQSAFAEDRFGTSASKYIQPQALQHLPMAEECLDIGYKHGKHDAHQKVLTATKSRERSSGRSGWLFTIITVHVDKKWLHKNTERHTVHTIVSWPNPKQYFRFDDDNKTKYIYSLTQPTKNTQKTHSPVYCIMDNWENVPYLTHTLDKIYLTGIL